MADYSLQIGQVGFACTCTLVLDLGFQTFPKGSLFLFRVLWLIGPRCLWNYIFPHLNTNTGAVSLQTFLSLPLSSPKPAWECQTPVRTQEPLKGNMWEKGDFFFFSNTGPSYWGAHHNHPLEFLTIDLNHQPFLPRSFLKSLLLHMFRAMSGPWHYIAQEPGS